MEHLFWTTGRISPGSTVDGVRRNWLVAWGCGALAGADPVTDRGQRDHRENNRIIRLRECEGCSSAACFDCSLERAAMIFPWTIRALARASNPPASLASSSEDTGCSVSVVPANCPVVFALGVIPLVCPRFRRTDGIGSALTSSIVWFDAALPLCWRENFANALSFRGTSLATWAC